ncbi:MAG: inorganic phosphate transporter [Candidatus Heimdallarchaeota archaeon]
MTDPLLITVALGVGLIVAFTIGANDETMTPAVGAGLLSLSMAVLLGGVINLIGVFFLGEKVSKTVGNSFSTETLTLPMIFIILISMAIWLFIVSMKGIPISTTQSVVGSVLGIVLIEWGPSAVNYETLIVVLLSWVISPLLGLAGGYMFYLGILKLQQSSFLERKGYSDYERQEKIMSYALAFFLIFTVLSRSGNDVAKAIGPLMAIPEILADPFMALLAGGVGMCLGVIVLGRRVVKKLAKDIVALSPSSALAASIAVSIIMFVGTMMAIPLSGSHILVAAFIGVGFVNKEKVDMDMLKEIGWSWIITTPISAIFSGGLFLIAKMFM